MDLKLDDNINKKKSLMSLRGVAFDLDETLLSRTRAFSSLVSEWARGCLDGEQMKMILDHDQNGYGNRMEFFLWLSDFLNLDLAAEETMLRFREDLPKYIVREKASVDLLKLLSEQGKITGILTNGGSELQRAKLNKSGIGAVVKNERIVISGDYGWKKPEKEIFNLLSEKMGLKPQEVLFIGDHYENDALGAYRAGLASVWLKKGREIPAGLPEEILVIDSLSELVDLYKV